jgi:tRNA (guanosine-2'-O-)-methyltransferase
MARTLKSKTSVKKLQREASAGTLEPGRELAFLLQDWEDAYNVGGMFRVADGCGATELVMTGRTPVPPNPMIGVTSLGQHRRIPFRHFKAHDEAAKAMVAEGWTLVAVELASDACDFQEFDYPLKTCLVLGNEGGGIYSAVMKHVSHCVFIPMLGKGRSLNVHVAAAIVGYQAALHRRESE